MSLSDHLFGGGVLGGSVVDHLASQGSLAYEREKGQLITVNAGSNKITVLAATAARSRATAAFARCWRRSQRGTAPWVSTPNATPEFLTAPGQVAFTPRGCKLLVTTKGNTRAIEVFDVNSLGGESVHPENRSPRRHRATR